MTAIVFVSGLAADRHYRLGGLTLLERALIVAARAGVRRCLVAGAVVLPSGDRRLPRLTPVADLDDALAVLRSESAESSRVLCLHASVVATPPSLARFIATAGDGPLVALHALPVAMAEAGALPSVWEPMMDPPADALHGLREGVFTHTPQCFFAWVRQASQGAEVERRLLRSLDNPRDGRLDTLLNRRLSRWLSRLLLMLPLTPNQVTALSLLSSLLAAWAFAHGTFGASLLGAALFQLSAVLDCCDGEIARVKFLESRFGDVFDIACDTVGNAAVFLGIARGAWVSGELADVGPISWALVLGILITFALVTWGERRLPEPAPTPAHRLAQRLIAGFSTRDFSALVFIAALTGTLPWFVRGAAVGVHLFWVLLAVLLLRGSGGREARG